MLYGLVEGLAGVQDKTKQFESISLSPRWSAANITEAEIGVGYECSGAAVSYSYTETANGVQLSINAKKSAANIQQLLPTGATVASISNGNANLDFKEIQIEQSRYVAFEANIAQGADLSITFR